MIDYYEYLCSDQWKEKRKSIIERCNNICENCKSKPVEDVHHLTYERLGNELLEDLLGLCKECHENKHPDKIKVTSNKCLSIEEIADICKVKAWQIYQLLKETGFIVRKYTCVNNTGNSYWYPTHKAISLCKESSRRSYNWNVEYIQSLVLKYNIVKHENNNLPDYMKVPPKKETYNQLISKYGLITKFNTRKRYWEIKKNNRIVATFNSTDHILIYKGVSHSINTFEEAITFINPKEI